MKLRSLLFVPGDRPDRMRKALTSGADALVIDLEDSVVPAAKQTARAHVAEFLSDVGLTNLIFVRINALDKGMVREDLAAILPGRPDGIMLPKTEGADDLATLDHLVAGTEILILPIITETPKAIFGVGTYSGVTDRLCGLTWGAEDLSAAVGASTAREIDGRYRPPYELARSLTLFAAHAAGVPAIETVFPSFSDADGLSAYAMRGRQDGFSGMMAIHPNQINLIHKAFTPSDAEVDRARRIVDLFSNNEGAGALSLDGQMVDRPHLAEARRLLSSLSD